MSYLPLAHVYFILIVCDLHADGLGKLNRKDGMVGEQRNKE